MACASGPGYSGPRPAITPCKQWRDGGDFAQRAFETWRWCRPVSPSCPSGGLTAPGRGLRRSRSASTAAWRTRLNTDLKTHVMTILEKRETCANRLPCASTPLPKCTKARQKANGGAGLQYSSVEPRLSHPVCPIRPRYVRSERRPKYTSVGYSSLIEYQKHLVSAFDPRSCCPPGFAWRLSWTNGRNVRNPCCLAGACPPFSPC